MVVGGRELIDTLWNVNYASGTSLFIKEGELIDTLWNVNFHDDINPSMRIKN